MTESMTLVDPLVDIAWLTEHLGDPLVRVVEVDVSPTAYQEWHLEGAALWNIYADLKTPDYRTIGPSEFSALLLRTGIRPDMTVVFYGYGPALGLWMMEYFGVGGARIVNASRDALRAAGLPGATAVDTRVALPDDAGAPLTPDASIQVGIEAVREAIADAHVTVMDVRSAAEYDGERFWPSGAPEPGGRAGHIRTAVHVPLNAIDGGLYDADGGFRPVIELRKAFRIVDLDGDDPIITYCTIGNRAAIAWFVLHHLLGRSGVRVYDGSWAEWGHLPDTPVETTH